MTDRSKFEQMLEHLINEDEAKARELFHDIVVAKSREIYEELLAEDFSEMAVPGEEEADQAAAEAAGDMDAGDDLLKDIESDDEEGGEMDMDMGDEEGEEITLSGGEVDELEDRVVDLEDALDALRDEFESLMGADEGDMGGEEEDEMTPEMDGEMPAMETPKNDEDDVEGDMDEQFIREYTEKVTAKMGDNGANTKSTVAKANNMGGVNGMGGKREADGKGGTQGGLLNPSTKEENAGNVNVPGGKAGVKHLKTVPAGHGAEKKGSKPDSEKSILGR